MTLTHALEDDHDHDDSDIRDSPGLVCLATQALPAPIQGSCVMFLDEWRRSDKTTVRNQIPWCSAHVRKVTKNV